MLLGNKPCISNYRRPTKPGGLLPRVSLEPTKYLVVDKFPSGNNHPFHAYCGHTTLAPRYNW